MVLFDGGLPSIATQGDVRSMLGDVVPHHNSTFHYKLDVLNFSNIDKRIACDGNDVRELACFD